MHVQRLFYPGKRVRGITPSISKCGNGYDKAIAEKFLLYCKPMVSDSTSRNLYKKYHCSLTTCSSTIVNKYRSEQNGRCLYCDAGFSDPFLSAGTPFPLSAPWGSGYWGPAPLYRDGQGPLAQAGELQHMEGQLGYGRGWRTGGKHDMMRGARGDAIWIKSSIC